ncbi:acetyl esterase/lipase [Pedobacter sp. UYEF25]
MFRLILIIFFFILSLVNFIPAQSKELWYLSILIPEFPYFFFLAMIPLLFWSYKKKKYRSVCLTFGIAAFLIFCSPVVRAYQVGKTLNVELVKSYGEKVNSLTGFMEQEPFSFWQMFFGNGAKKIPYKTYQYAINGGEKLSLNFTPSAIHGIRPCLFVVHGGSWKRGDNSEIEAMNNYFANAGYQVSTMNYRLAPKSHSPATQEDVKSAFKWLKLHADQLKIDTTNFVMLGRSAGGQIVATSAYVNTERGVKGVMIFYGPNDMYWSYKHPDNPLIMDSKMVQRDFLGGGPRQVPDRYTAESAYLFVNRNTMPTLQVHGMIDAHVHYEQSLRMAKKLDKFGVKNFLLSLPWATHGCEYNLNGPSGQLSVYSMERFAYSVTHP